MKRILIRTIAVLAVALGICASCGKVDQPAGCGTVTINIGGVLTGEITKTDADAVAAVLRSTAPSGVASLTLQSTTNSKRSYQVTPGVPINLPYDIYTVTGRYTPAKVGDTFRGVVYHEPRYNVSATIEVIPDKDEYEVPATYECFALIIDWATTLRYTHVGKDTNVADFTFFAGSGDLGVAYIFISSEWGEMANKITAYPVDEAEHEATEYRLVSNRNYAGHYIEYGKWYALSPAAVETEAGALGVRLPDWIAGTL